MIKKVIEKEELLKIIPHRNSLMLITRINGYDEDERSIEAEYEIADDCIFFDPILGGVPSWTSFEFVAQAISAFIGIRDRFRKHKIGYIVSISQLKMELPFFKTGSIIEIKTKEIDGMDPVYVFQGDIYLDGKRVVEGKITVMDVRDEPK